jgi:hypothetical protein
MSGIVQTNLDKICAEYGMDLLNKFSSLDIERLKRSVTFNGLENIVEQFKYDKDEKEIDKSKINEYSQKLQETFNQIIKEIKNCSELNEIEKFITITWALYPFGKKLYQDVDFSKIKEISKEKERIKKLINNFEIKFTFSASQFETEITKALGILVEDGPFAYFIWLKSQDKEPHQAMLIQTAIILEKLNLIENILPEENIKSKLEEAFLEKISTDLTKTLFVKTILEKMLIYARYKAKAMQHE